MAKASILTAARLRELLHYNPKTGKFRHLKGGRNKWRSTVGYVAKDGYVRIYFERKQYLGHRLAWLWMTGQWPKQDIDHRNRRRADNRWCNLRNVTRSENCKNNKLQGRAGVSLDKSVPERASRWKVYIWRKNVGHIHIGRYATRKAAMKVAKLFYN